MTSQTPHLDRYIASLPQGLASYPDVQQKSAILHSLLGAWPEHAAALEGAPAALRELAMNPPPKSLWISEVMGIALWVAAIDLAGDGTFAGFRPMSLRANRLLMDNPLYALVFRSIGGRLTVRAAATAWTSFHRGIEQDLQLEGTVATITLRFPAGVIPAILAPSFGIAFEVGLDVAGVKNVRQEILQASTTEVVYRVAW